MSAPDTSSRSGLKAALLSLLQGGAATVVVASAVLAAPSAATASAPRDTLLERADEARAQLLRSLPAAEQVADKPVELAWWGNRWPNGSWRPAWNNWPNFWHNWNNWGNWPGQPRRR